MKINIDVRKPLAFILAVSLLFSWRGLIVFAEDPADDTAPPADAFIEVSETADPVSEADMAEISRPQLSAPTDTQETGETGTDTTEADLTQTDTPDKDVAETEMVEAETAYPFDPQPATMEEVQGAIDSYEAAYQEALSNGGFSEALKVQKPRWQYQVAEELMPDGWRCDSLVDGEYDVTYWTFFPTPVALSAQITTVLELQAEIDAADEQAMIILDDGFSFDGTVVTIPSGKNITIRAEGDAVTLWQAAGTRHFIVDGELALESIILDGSTDGTAETAIGGGVQLGGGSFTMSGNAVIQNCKSVNGGGIDVQTNNATLNGVVVENCRAERGGGIYSSGSLTIIDSSILNNRAGAMGGGVCADGALSIVDSRINNNTVEADVSARGGGIYASGALDISGEAEIAGNRIYNPTTASVTHLGGGIYAAGALDIKGASTGSIVVSDNHIDGVNINTSANGGGIYANGGATIANARISGNSTKRMGGGIAVGGGKNLALDNTTVSGNWTTYSHTTAEGGGGIYMAGVSNRTVTLAMQNGAKIAGNGMAAGGEVRTNYGGGVLCYYNLIVEGGEVSGNAANTNGGGVEVYTGSQLTLSGTLVRGNWSGNGGGVYLGANGGFGSATLYMKDGAQIIGNGMDAGGKVRTSYGGGVASYGNPNYNLTLTIDASGNGDVEAIAGNNANTSGGGVYYSNNLKLINATVSGNSAANGGGVYIQAQCSDNTGAEGYLYNKTIDITGGAISGNTAGGNGGGIYNGMPYKPYYASKYTYRLAAVVKTDGGAVITGNTAQKNGGGICLDAGDATGYVGEKTVGVEIGDGTAITNNTATGGSGGGVYTDQTENLSSAANTVFSGNQAAQKVIPDPYTALAFPAIRYASTSIMDNGGYVHPLNDYDINPRNVAHFTVTYYSNGGDGGPCEDIAAYVKSSGEHPYTVLTAEAAGISRIGGSFTGWSTKPDGGGAHYSPGSQVTFRSGNDDPLVLYAQWEINRYTVALYDEDGSTLLSSQEYSYSDSIVLPEAPVKSPDAQYSYRFTGWQAGGDYTVSDPVTQDMEFTAVYANSKNQYTVTFYDYDGITVLDSRGVNYGDSVTPPVEPARHDDEQYIYAFSGWIPGGSYMLDDLQAVTQSMTFTADYKATIKTFTVSFESNGGSAVSSIGGIPYGKVVAAPPNPTRINYSFDGWYRDNGAFQARWDFAADPVTMDITLYAKWKPLLGGSGNNGGAVTGGRRIGDGYYSADNEGYTRIEDPPTPLAETPIPDTAEIADGNIPLSSNPYTGRMHNPAYALSSLVISGVCVLGSLILRKKKNG